MTEQDVLRRLSAAMDHAAPNDLDGVLSRCHAQKGSTHMNENTAKTKKSFRSFALPALAASLALVLAVGGWGMWQNGVVASAVSLDVNPSVQLRLNKHADVVSATAVNDDAAKILEGMDLKGVDVNVAVNALVGSLLKHGYVDELANSILVTVEDSDSARGAALQTTLAQEIDDILRSASVHAAILSQTVDRDNTLQEKADQYDISVGKATLIQSIVDQSAHLRFEDLAGLTVNELNLLSSNSATALPETVASTGSASDGAYIGAEQAKAIAFTAAGTTAGQAKGVEVDFDYEDGRMVYEVEFYVDGRECDMTIDARTGEVVKLYTEPAFQETDSSSAAGGTTGTTGTTGSAASTAIGVEQAKRIALENAGLSAADVTGLRAKEDWDDGTLEYDVRFYANSVEYEYEITGYTGKILKAEQDRDNDDRDDDRVPSSTQPTAPADIGAEAAKAVALRHAGISASDAYDLSVERDMDNGRLHYEVDFKSGNMEYEYDINAADGAILSHQSEQDD